MFQKYKSCFFRNHYIEASGPKWGNSDCILHVVNSLRLGSLNIMSMLSSVYWGIYQCMSYEFRIFESFSKNVSDWNVDFFVISFTSLPPLLPSFFLSFIHFQTYPLFHLSISIGLCNSFIKNERQIRRLILSSFLQWIKICVIWTGQTRDESLWIMSIFLSGF